VAVKAREAIALRKEADPAAIVDGGFGHKRSLLCIAAGYGWDLSKVLLNAAASVNAPEDFGMGRIDYAAAQWGTRPLVLLLTYCIGRRSDAAGEGDAGAMRADPAAGTAGRSADPGGDTFTEGSAEPLAVRG
jgi:hypothetical protein